MKAISLLEQSGCVNIVVRAVVHYANRYLLVQEGKPDCYGLWSFPGGKLDVGEYLTQAIIREVDEETGIRILPTGILALRQGPWEDAPGTTLTIVFLAEAETIPSPFPTSPEILTVAWKTPAELTKLAQAKQMRNPEQTFVANLLQQPTVLPLSHLFETPSLASRNLP